MPKEVPTALATAKLFYPVSQPPEDWIVAKVSGRDAPVLRAEERAKGCLKEFLTALATAELLHPEYIAGMGMGGNCGICNELEIILAA